MKFIFTILIILFSPTVFSFSATENVTSNVSVEWVWVKNIQTACDSYSKKKGLGGFKYAVEACSFWEKSWTGKMTCKIFTEKTLSHDTLGHELRHCFQGNFHSQPH